MLHVREISEQVRDREPSESLGRVSAMGGGGAGGALGGGGKGGGGFPLSTVILPSLGPPIGHALTFAAAGVNASATTEVAAAAGAAAAALACLSWATAVRESSSLMRASSRLSTSSFFSRAWGEEGGDQKGSPAAT